jgi:hypothetical protein
VIILGIILLVIGYLVGISLLVTLGWIVLIIGLVFLVLAMAGHGVGGRYWY